MPRNRRNLSNRLSHLNQRSLPSSRSTARTAVELPLEIPATLEPEPVSAVEAEDPITAAPELEPEPRIDPTLPIAATQDPEPATDTPPPSRRPIVSYTPAERHPLAAFADADRHPLAAFARRDTPSPTSEPPPIDDLFPDELAPVEVEYSVGRQPDFTDVPSIDDLLPPEAGETDVPPRGESPLASEPPDPSRRANRWIPSCRPNPWNTRCWRSQSNPTSRR